MKGLERQWSRGLEQRYGGKEREIDRYGENEYYRVGIDNDARFPDDLARIFDSETIYRKRQFEFKEDMKRNMNGGCNAPGQVLSILQYDSSSQQRGLGLVWVILWELELEQKNHYEDGDK